LRCPSGDRPDAETMAISRDVRARTGLSPSSELTVRIIFANRRDRPDEARQARLAVAGLVAVEQVDLRERSRPTVEVTGGDRVEVGRPQTGLTQEPSPMGASTSTDLRRTLRPVLQRVQVAGLAL
jgi:hypothetical protein